MRARLAPRFFLEQLFHQFHFTFQLIFPTQMVPSREGQLLIQMGVIIRNAPVLHVIPSCPVPTLSSRPAARLYL